jgi:hypothetical protein
MARKNANVEPRWPGTEHAPLSLRDASVVLIQLLLPTTGKAEAISEHLADTHRELTEQFTGLTAYLRSPAKGWWTSADGRTEADDVVMVEVVTDEFDRAWWGAYAKTLARRFQQDAIHVRALRVEMLDEAAR